MVKISIITICYNNEKDIRATLESVVNQTYPNIEYIVKDGGSKDSSLSIINEYKDKIAKIISEPDNGIYDAINEGIKAATGDVVGLIHAGDRLHDNEVISKIAAVFNNDSSVDATYGVSKTVNEEGKIIGIKHNPKFNLRYIKWGWMPSHQSIYLRRDYFEKFGYYRTDLGGAADYEWFIRYFYLHGEELNVHRMKDYVIWFSMGGVSTKSYKAKLNMKGTHSDVIMRSWTENGLKPFGFLPLVRPYWLLKIYVTAFFTRNK